jgi:Hemoglobin-like flavoprotein
LPSRQVSVLPDFKVSELRTASPQAIATVKASTPIIERHGVAIATVLYRRLFAHAGIAAMFDDAGQDSAERPRRLAAAILAYARNIDTLHVLAPRVQQVVARHVETRVKAEHYPFVATALLASLCEVLGDEIATDDMLVAWDEAYWMLADILITAEAEQYGKLAA